MLKELDLRSCTCSDRRATKEMQQGSGTFPAAPAVVPTRQLHRQAMAVLGAVCALVVVACVALVHTGSRATLVQVAAVQRVPVMAPAELARAPVWAPRLEHAKAKVGQALAQDMRKLWADDRRDKTHDSLVNEDKDLSELRQVEFLKNRYEAIEKALAVAPMLDQVQGARAARPGELLVQNPRTGQRFLLYEYHVPGAGTSAGVGTRGPRLWGSSSWACGRRARTARTSTACGVSATGNTSSPPTIPGACAC